MRAVMYDFLAVHTAVSSTAEVGGRAWGSVGQYGSSVRQCKLQRVRYSVSGTVQKCGDS